MGILVTCSPKFIHRSAPKSATRRPRSTKGSAGAPANPLDGVAVSTLDMHLDEPGACHEDRRCHQRLPQRGDECVDAN